MFTIALIPNSDGDDCRFPITNEPLGTGIEDRLTAHSLGTSTINKLIIEANCAVTSWKYAPRLFLGFAVRFSWFEFSTFAVSSSAFDIFKFEVDDLVNNDI